MPTTRSRSRRVAPLMLACAIACANLAHAADPHAHHAHGVPARGEAQVVKAAYRLPATPLVRQDGAAVSLTDEMAGARAVVVGFIYTTCTAICPVTSQLLSQVHDRLRGTDGDVRILSVSIDPEHDTPARLREYAARFEAGPQWRHYTGTRRASIEVQKAFSAYYGDKMNHQPAIFVKTGDCATWTRFEGFPTPAKVLEAIRARDACPA